MTSKYFLQYISGYPVANYDVIQSEVARYKCKCIRVSYCLTQMFVGREVLYSKRSFSTDLNILNAVRYIFCICSNFFLTFLLFLYSTKMLFIRDGFHKNACPNKQTGKTLIKLLLQKQFDLGLHCLSRPFWQATSISNFRKFTVDLKCKAHSLECTR